MKQSTPNAHVSFEGFTATPSLIEQIESKSAKLRRHHAARIVSLHLHIRLEKPHTGPALFKASATMRDGGRDTAIHSTVAEPESLINDVFSKLERSLQDHAGERKHSRHSTEPSTPV